MASKQLQSKLHHKLLRYLVLLLICVGAGTFGYCMIEHWHPFDALYMTITTLTTVGYGEVHPLHRAGRIFTIGLILVGVGTLLYILSDTAQLIADTDPRELFGRKRMRDKIEKLKNHQIVCGFGRTGQEVAKQFMATGVDFVIIETDMENSRRAQDQGYLIITGDATEDGILREAQVSKANGIVCALSDDAANTFIALSAKEFNEKIKIVCRAANPGAESKMKRAGADKVISPYVIAGRRMASAVTHPLVMDFLDIAMHNPGFDLRLEQIMISLHGKLAGLTLRDANIKQTVGAMVLAVNKKGQLLTNPGPDLVFEDGDILVALGAEDELTKLGALAGAKKS
ncbi:MAG: potassium channel protein [Candidatus Obscuribacterales bacterium]|nr:potassium channel protein [Candidatus Obscuribacterales bacterium]